MTRPLLSIRDLSLAFGPAGRTAPVLDAVSFDIAAEETLGLVGESGSGKSVLALALLRLLGATAEIRDGTALFDGVDLLAIDEARMRALRGTAIALIFQNPAASLNPLRRVGVQIADVLRAHGTVTRAEARKTAVTMLDRVGIPDAARRIDAHPFELSGGTKQRVMIALALAAGPRLLIADEATTGLDVTTQAMVLDLLAEQQRERHMSTLLLTHDLAVASQRCQRIVVMHAGQVVEWAPAAQLVGTPRHPYSQALLAATPRAGMTVADLDAIPGRAPDLAAPDLPACRFFDRCPRRIDPCRTLPPPKHRSEDGASLVACHRPL